MQAKRQTAILIMGTFNPITSAHVALGEEAKKVMPWADVIYVPSNLSFMRDWKEIDEFLSDEDRISLIRESIASIPDASVSDIEITGVSDGRTYNSVNIIKEKYEEAVIVMGIDKLDELDRWYNADRLFSENKVLVFERSGENLESRMTDFIRQRRDSFVAESMPACYGDISSTAVRKAFKEGNLAAIEEYVPQNVYAFLLSRKNTIN